MRRTARALIGSSGWYQSGNPNPRFQTRNPSASTTTSFLFVSPVLATLIAWIWRHEIPGLTSLLGGAVALGGVLLVNTLGRPAAPALVVPESSAKAS